MQTRSVSGGNCWSSTSLVFSEDMVVVLASLDPSSGGLIFGSVSSIDFLRGLGGSSVTDSSLVLRLLDFGPTVTPTAPPITTHT